jgi:DNA repair photolyase
VLVGIAKLAAQSETLETKKRVEYLEIETRQFIGRCSNPRMPFVWTINSYRGCEFGCKYCYARYAHEFMELRDPLEFERKIFAKRFDAGAFRRELSKIKKGQSIWIGTATDPYQPAERRYGVTRSILEVFREEYGFELGITTKSDLVRRDAQLIGRIARRNGMCVNLTITTLDEGLARMLEPMAPRPALRLEAVRMLADFGVRVTVMAHPVMPLINDSEESLGAVAEAAKESGAAAFSAAPLFLKPCSARVFLPFLEEKFPHLVRKYRERYAAGAYLKGAYPDLIRERAQRILARLGLERREPEHRPEYWEAEPQLHLFSN